MYSRSLWVSSTHVTCAALAGRGSRRRRARRAPRAAGLRCCLPGAPPARRQDKFVALARRRVAALRPHRNKHMSWDWRAPLGGASWVDGYVARGDDCAHLALVAGPQLQRTAGRQGLWKLEAMLLHFLSCAEFCCQETGTGLCCCREQIFTRQSRKLAASLLGAGRCIGCMGCVV